MATPLHPPPPHPPPPTPPSPPVRGREDLGAPLLRRRDVEGRGQPLPRAEGASRVPHGRGEEDETPGPGLDHAQRRQVDPDLLELAEHEVAGVRRIPLRRL